jgi:hypothetical protein
MLLFLAEHVHEEFIFTMAIDRTTGLPMGLRSTIHCVVTAISVYDVYNGLIPASWTRCVSSRCFRVQYSPPIRLPISNP